MWTYADILTLKGTHAANITGTVHDGYLRLLLETSAKELDNYAGRSFHPQVGTKFFDGPGGTMLHVPDLISVGTLQEDDNEDGTFDAGWATTDYHLWPYNAAPTSDWGRPYQAIVVSNNSTATKDVFAVGQRNYLISGTWGYSAVTVTLGLTVSSSLSDTATSFPLSGSASGTVEAGMVLLVGTEQIYVRTGGAGTAVTVTRGVNGAVASVIASGSAIAVYSYPPPITEAVLANATRLFKRAQAAFASQAGAPDGQVTVFQGGLDRDVRYMVDGYRRPALLGLGI